MVVVRLLDEGQPLVEEGLDLEVVRGILDLFDLVVKVDHVVLERGDDLLQLPLVLHTFVAHVAHALAGREHGLGDQDLLGVRAVDDA